MTEELHDPLVSAEVDLRNFGFMPLDVRRLLTSETWIEAGDKPKVGHAVMCLWCESWHQVPAASLPDNDKVLARLAMCDARTWQRIRVDVLRGWMKCSDGLLYHPVVAEKARESWAAKVKQRKRTKAATEAREAKRRADQAERDAQRDVERNGTRNVERDAQRDVHQGTVKGQGQLRDSKGTGKGDNHKVNPLSAAAEKPAASDPGKTVETWNAYSRAYQERYGVEPLRNAKVNGQLGKLVDQVGAEEAPKLAEFYLTHNGGLYVSSGHCVDLLLRDCSKFRTEMITGRKITRLEARNAEHGDALRAQTERVGRILEGSKA